MELPEQCELYFPLLFLSYDFFFFKWNFFCVCMFTEKIKVMYLFIYSLDTHLTMEIVIPGKVSRETFPRFLVSSFSLFLDILVAVRGCVIKI